MKNEEINEDPCTIDYLVISKESGLSFSELDMMSIGMVLDYVRVYFKMKAPKDKDKPTVRKATQADINALKI